MLKWLATFILAMGLADDLKTRKIHNKLVIALLVVTLGYLCLFQNKEQIEMGFLAMACSLLVTLPLVLVGALGGGDMKLFAVFALTSRPDVIIWVVGYSIIWGAILGLVRAGIDGQILSVFRGMAELAIYRQGPKERHTIPFSVAMMFGWLTQLSLSGGLPWR